MSTRWYPIYQRGGPQLRIFLPNFWMKLVKPTHQQPPNVVQFACSMEMSSTDIKNYLEKIYQIKTVHISTRIASGKTRRDPGKGYIVKDDDTKYAYVTLHKSEKFEFPVLYPEKEKDVNEQKTMEEMQAGYKEYLEKNKERKNMPGWFTI
ncbi:probable 39S ribosomal protein L23, mitochondrial [Coccinella septempunctata]|uniref:probable 39S ribosomal protein L23, mitochondrial n=1 Tax=Coccinella septempunctata TaxID=41139 RepID=UPI001D07A67C|nr:probable 39S ribosomal protein L23, mitochondrial [Coccinella septempunctata]